MRMDVPYIQHESGALWNDGWIKNCKGNYNVLEYTSVLENELEENEEGSKNEIHTHRRHTFGGRSVHWKLPKGKAGKGDMDQS